MGSVSPVKLACGERLTRSPLIKAKLTRSAGIGFLLGCLEHIIDHIGDADACSDYPARGPRR